MKITSENQNQAIAALRKCAMENSNRQTDTGCIRIADLCNDVADYLETLPKTISEDIEKEIEEHAGCMPMSEFTHDSEIPEYEDWAKNEFRYFYDLGLKAQQARQEDVIKAHCTAHKVYRNIDGCDYGDLEFDDFINFTEVGLRDGDALDITIRHRKDETI